MGQLWKEINWKLFGKKVLGFEEALEEGAKKSIEEQLGFKLEVDEQEEQDRLRQITIDYCQLVSYLFMIFDDNNEKEEEVG